MTARSPGRRRSPLLVAAAAAAAAVVAAVLHAAPAHATVVKAAAPEADTGSVLAGSVLFGLDCGVVGEMHAVGYPPHYTFDVQLTAGPYVVSGTNAYISCSLRAHDPGGPVLTSWGVGGLGTGTVPPMPPEVRQFTYIASNPIIDIYLCSRVSWTSIGEWRSEVGCERVGGTDLYTDNPADDPWFHVGDIHKPQDADLDDNFP